MLEDINRFDDCYEIIKRKKNNKVISFITILLITLFIFLLYFFTYGLKQTKTYYGTIIMKEKDYVYVKIISSTEYVYFNDKTILVIDDKEVNYEIVDVINNMEYNEIILKLQLNYEPRILKLTFILNEKTLFEKMKEALIYGKNFKQ